MSYVENVLFAMLLIACGGETTETKIETETKTDVEVEVEEDLKAASGAFAEWCRIQAACGKLCSETVQYCTDTEAQYCVMALHAGDDAPLCTDWKPPICFKCMR